MRGTITSDELKRLIVSSFPEEPAPSRVLSSDATLDDISHDIEELFQGKKWTDIQIDAWRKTGVPIIVIVLYFDPLSFSYYLPSLLVSSIEDGDFDYSIDALLPSNQRREPRGDWWRKFSESLNSMQRRAIRQFLRYALDINPEHSTPNMEAQSALAAGYYE